MKIKLCKNCGFILGTRPNLKDVDGVCTACLNKVKKKDVDFIERQSWLTKYIEDNRTHAEYDCLIAVSGGKDSTTIVGKLFESHGIQRALLVHVSDCFTHTETGKRNLENIQNKFNCDLVSINFNHKKLTEHMRKDFEETLNPLKWLEQQIYIKPLEIAKQNGIKLVFYGENAEFEYGSSKELDVFHPATTDELKVIYLGAIYPYSAQDWYEFAKSYGFIDLDFLNEWQRQGQIENYSQIDSIGYHMGIWTKFVKFGFQRVSDMACRFVRDGVMGYEQAQLLIKEQDYLCDPASKKDFCRAIGITEKYFDKIVDLHANTKLVKKDINGAWRRIDMM